MSEDRLETATLAGGCFWCLQPLFEDVRGVEGVEVGYSGGTVADPSYRQVCTGTTGHAEAVQIRFDPAVLSYEDLLRIFFSVHDPTTLSRQGPDVGTQYRSAIFFHTQPQKEAADRVIAELNPGVWQDPIVTELTPFETFYRGEEYHQNYYLQNPDQPYCRAIITPKVVKFRKQFHEKLRTSAGDPQQTT
ncbi:MAG: peptide-methionine (S)-S-oxide reductase MsrA [Candidatus Thermoplasmatota archaeon]|nr:peptide-methionine (S)-S-oxide reductase MsrA [Candidatus Thermoplasmatota archaeon]